MEYRPEIDGLRALAVIPVILFHAGFSMFSGGYVGVDVFFVISGYLITSILLNDLDRGRYSIADFYERRARRILPALFLVIACSIALAMVIMLPGSLKEFGQSIAATALFVANIYFYVDADYFDSAAELKPMLHMWSLAVEEQFYILFPPMLALGWRYGVKVVLGGLVATFVLSLILAEIVVHRDAGAAFYLLPTRAWELAVGGILAVILRGRTDLVPPGLAEAGGLLGIGMILASIVQFDAATPFPGVAALLPTLGAGLIIACAGQNTIAGRLLSLPIFVGIGLISYSAYLWHQPLFAFARHYALVEPEPWVMPALSLLSLVLAWFSWRFVERPFRGKSVPRSTIVRASVVGLAAVVAIGIAGHVYGPGYEGPATRRGPDLADYRYDNTMPREESWAPLRQLAGNSSYKHVDNPYDREAWFDPSDPRKTLLVVGNSHAKDTYNLVMASAALKQEYQIARFGIQIADLPGDLRSSPNYRAADVVMLSSLYSERDAGRISAAIRMIREDGKTPVITTQLPLTETYKHGLLNLADVMILEAYESGARDPLAMRDEVNQAYFTHFHDARARNLAAPARSAIERAQREFPDLIVLDRLELICDDARRSCLGVDDRLRKIFYDGGHLTLHGAGLLGQRADAIGWFAPLLNEASAGS